MVNKQTKIEKKRKNQKEMSDFVVRNCEKEFW
jgi:hypothetical protein